MMNFFFAYIVACGGKDLERIPFRSFSSNEKDTIIRFYPDKSNRRQYVFNFTDAPNVPLDIK